MVTSGLYFFPCPPNSTSSPTYQTLTSHLMRRNAEYSLLPPFQLEHRLYTTTPSLLPGSKLHDRQYTQVISISRTPAKTFVGVSPSPERLGDDGEGLEASVVSIPSGAAADSFNDLIIRKLQPMWALRQSARIDHGFHIVLVPGEWQIHIGEIRVSSGQGQSNLKGVAVGLHWMGDDESGPGGSDLLEDQTGVNEMIFASFFDALFRDSAVGHAGLRSITKVKRQDVFMGKKSQEDRAMQLACQYMELLRFDTSADAPSPAITDFRSRLKMWRT